MTAYFRCSGAVGSELLTEMNAAFNEVFETSSVNYPVKEWADDTNLLGPIPIVTKTGTNKVNFSNALERPLQSLKFKLTDTFDEGYDRAVMQVTRTEGGGSIQRGYTTLFQGYTLQGGILDAINKVVINPLIKVDFDHVSISSRLGNDDICVIYTIGVENTQGNDIKIRPYEADADVVKCNELPTVPSISLTTTTEGVSADSGALKVSIECANLTGDLDTNAGRRQALLDWIAANDAVFLVSPWKEGPVGSLVDVVIPCWPSLTDETDPSEGFNELALVWTSTPTDWVEVSYWLDINA